MEQIDIENIIKNDDFHQLRRALDNEGLDSVENVINFTYLLALSHNSFNCIKLLIEYGADIHFIEHISTLGFHFSLEKLDFRSIEYIVKAGLDVNRIIEIDQCGFMSLPDLLTVTKFKEETVFSLVYLYLLHGYDIHNFGNRLNNSILYIGIYRVYVQVVELVAYSSYSVNAPEYNPLQGIPLIIACQYQTSTLPYSDWVQKSTRIVQILIDNGANVQVTDLNGFKPITYASYYKNLEMIKVLLHKGYRYRMILVQRIMKAIVSSWEIDFSEKLVHYNNIMTICKRFPQQYSP